MMNSGFRSLHPLPCFFYYAGVILLSMLLLHPTFLLTSAVLLGLLNYMLQNKAGSMRSMLWFLLIGIALFILNPLFSHRGEHIMFYLWDQPITLEAVCYGLTITLSTLSIMLAFLSYQKVITSDKFLFLFSSIWPKGSLITVMAMRFVPLLTDRLRNIGHVQQTKGISMREGSLAKRAANGMKLLQILLTWSLEEALQTADSMKARGFGLKKRSVYTAYRMRSRDWRMLAVLTFLLLTCLTGRMFSDYGLLTIYPTLETWRMSGPEFIHYAVFITYVALPLMMEGKELIWRLSR